MFINFWAFFSLLSSKDPGSLKVRAMSFRPKSSLPCLESHQKRHRFQPRNDSANNLVPKKGSTCTVDFPENPAPPQKGALEMNGSIVLSMVLSIGRPVRGIWSGGAGFFRKNQTYHPGKWMEKWYAPLGVDEFRIDTSESSVLWSFSTYSTYWWLKQPIWNIQ